MKPACRSSPPEGVDRADGRGGPGVTIGAVTAHRPSGTDRDTAALDQVEQVIRRALGARRTDVYLFGSWARGIQRPTSDIDVAIGASEPLPPGLLASLRETLEESTIPYRVDVVDLAEADPAFRERVQRDGRLWIASGNA